MSKAPMPSFSEILQLERNASRIRIIKAQKTSALVIRPKTASTHNETKRKLANEITLRNLPVKIKKNQKNFQWCKPKKRRSQVIFGINKDVTKQQLADGLVFKNDLLKSDNPENPKFMVNFSIKSKYGANWIISVEPDIYAGIKKDKGLFFDWGFHRIDDFHSDDLGFSLDFYSPNHDPLDLLIEEDLNIVFSNLKGAFADDLALVTFGRTREILELNTNNALDLIFKELNFLKLEVASDKCQALAFRSISSRSLSKHNKTVFNRNPIFKLNGKSVKSTKTLKYLGILFDNKLTWNPHIFDLLRKAYNLCFNFNGLIESNWSVSPFLLKFWYHTVVEKAFLYGTSVWGRALTNAQILKLHSIQIMFLLKLSRSYKTTSTNALNVILGIPPLHVVIKSLVTRFKIWKLRSDRHIELMHPLKLDFYRDIKDIPSNEKIVIIEKDFACDYVVYTNGSKIDGNAGFSVCIFERNSLLPVHCYKLNIFNSVFQAELAPIDFAAGWVLDKNVKIKNFTDSKSSIEALRSANIKSNFVFSVKEHLYKAKDLVSLAWVKAHAGNPGNELADHFAKIASFCGTEMYIPAPYLFVKRTSNDLLIRE
ncbi:hypothetical protein AVEN_234350-1 [Araneus ventricosus]|uniref:RNase H type-1 domain-containing protein n=1 Tax=Araneus ventricosus TaxID=182803 RepID=A0A4Y2A8F3_ARAVE|nr:hypothetical protein AVEN_234350-1 [Araneus ventricosus]